MDAKQALHTGKEKLASTASHGHLHNGARNPPWSLRSRCDSRLRDIHASAGRGTASERLGSAREVFKDASDAPVTGQHLAANLREEARQDRTRRLDKIIAVFWSKPSSEWRKLIAFSKQWSSLQDRLDHRVDTEKDAKEKGDLRKLARKLRDVNDELQQCNEVLGTFLAAPEAEWESLVAAGRGSLTTDFFAHVENLIRANHDEPDRANELARMATRLLILVEAFDKVTANENALQAAAQEFEALLKSVKSIEDADERIDKLASSGKLDPALMLTMAKAYSSVKDTDYTREEVKDVMAHLYFKAKESFAAQQPPSVRILKHLLCLQSPAEQREAMEQAFTPGAQLSSATEDYLATTPEELGQLMAAILSTYENRHSSRSQMQAEANAMMNPDVIDRMRRLQAELRKHFL